MKLKEIKKLLDLPEWAELTYSNFSDVCFSCFGVAKKEGKRADILARDLAESIKSNYIRSIEALNGYVNINLDFNSLNPSANFILKDEDSKVNNNFSGKTIRLEHTSVNPNKGLHIGHMRNSYIGEFIRRSLLYSSANVIVSNFIEDTGAQVADIIVGFKFLGKKMETDKKFDLYCSGIYKEINEMYEKDKNLLEKRKEVLLSIENGDKETLDILNAIVEKVLSAQILTLSNQKIKYDLLDLERYILGEGIVKKALSKLIEDKIAFKSESEKNSGCIVTIVDDKEVTLTRSDGTSLYIAKDIAYAMMKHSLLNEVIKYSYFGRNYDGSDIKISDAKGKEENFKKIDISFTLTDSSQNAEQSVVKAIIDGLSGKDSYRHYSYEPVAISKDTASIIGINTEENFIRMSGRKGITIEFDNLIKSVEKRIREQADINGKEIADDELFKMASNVIRYYILKYSPSKMVIFDIKEATSLKGDTAVYINYSYSRAKSILRKGSKKEEINVSFGEEENNFMRKLLFWEENLDNAISNLKANIICDYLHSVCDTFNSFYERNRIIGDRNEASRMILVEYFVKIVEKLCYFLGIELIERM